MRDASLPGLAKQPCGCIGKCTCSPLKLWNMHDKGGVLNRETETKPVSSWRDMFQGNVVREKSQWGPVTAHNQQFKKEINAGLGPTGISYIDVSETGLKNPKTPKKLPTNNKSLKR